MYVINAMSAAGSQFKKIRVGEGLALRVGWPSFTASMSETIGSSRVDLRDDFELRYMLCESSAVALPASPARPSSTP